MSYTLTNIYQRGLVRGDEFELPIESFLYNNYIEELNYKSATKQEDSFNSLPEPIQTGQLYKYLMAIKLLTDLTEEFTEHVKTLETPLKMIAVYLTVQEYHEGTNAIVQEQMETIVKTSNVSIEDVNKLVSLQELISGLNTIVQVTEKSLGVDALKELNTFIEASKYAHDSPTARKDMEESAEKMNGSIPGVNEHVEDTLAKLQDDVRSLTESINMLKREPRGEAVVNKPHTDEHGNEYFKTIHDKDFNLEENKQIIEDYIKRNPDLTEQQIANMRNNPDELPFNKDPNYTQKQLKAVLAKDKKKEEVVKKPMPTVVEDSVDLADLEQTVMDTQKKTKPVDEDELGDYEEKGIWEKSVDAGIFNNVVRDYEKLKDKFNAMVSKKDNDDINARLLDEMKATVSKLKRERAYLEKQLMAMNKKLEKFQVISTQEYGYVSSDALDMTRSQLRQATEDIRMLNEKLKEALAYNNILVEENQHMYNSVENERHTSATTHFGRAFGRLYRKLTGDE